MKQNNLKNLSDKELQKLVDNYGIGDERWWYQPIKFKENVMTHSNKWNDNKFYSMRTFGVNKWNNFVIPFLPFSLKNKVVLDIGCNAGIFLIQAIKAGAKFAYGIEPTPHFYDQCIFVIDMFSEIENFDYHKKIKIIKKEVHKINWTKEILHYVDVTFAYNVLYWLTFSDEKGTIPNAPIILKKVLNDISLISKYLMIMGDEKADSSRRRKENNYLCVGLKNTLKFLENYTIKKTWIENPPLERHPSIIVAKSNKFDFSSKKTIEVDKLIKFLSLKASTDKFDNGFFEAYTDFCNRALEGTLDINNNLYKKWIKKRLTKPKYLDYRGFNKNLTESEFNNKLQKDIDLLFDIKKNGMIFPIIIKRGSNFKNGFFEIDGYHRLVICKVLGVKYIEVKYTDVLYDECIKRLQKI